MFGINSNGDISNQAGAVDGSMPAGPMVPDDNGVDQPTHMPAPAADPPADAPSAPPMPNGPSAADQPIALDMPDDSQPVPSTPVPTVTGPAGDNLLMLKQQALQSLAPLVDHLDQTPEEKFKTTMMMLQASDNPELVKEAYAAANAISDEKIRAQALLDVVNEINYFTQHTAKNGQAAA